MSDGEQPKVFLYHLNEVSDAAMTQRMITMQQGDIKIQPGLLSLCRPALNLDGKKKAVSLAGVEALGNPQTPILQLPLFCSLRVNKGEKTSTSPPPFQPGGNHLHGVKYMLQL